MEVSREAPAPEPEEAVLLEQFDLDPGRWEIVAARKSQWQSGDRWLEARRVSFRKRGSGLSVTTGDVDAIMSRYYTPTGITSDTTSDWNRIVMVPAGDLQLGKQEGGGTAATIERFCRITDTIREELAGGVGTLILPWLGDCLSFDTEIVTRNGIVRIGDVAGQEVEVRDGHGGWVRTTIRSYGPKPLMRVTWKARKAVKVVHTSPGHEWWLRNGERVRTEDLKPGMSVVKSARGKSLPTLSPAGIQAGFIFGDGTDSIQGARAGFYGDKDQAMLPWFSVEAAEASYPYADARGDLRTNGIFPRSWKLSPPSLDEGTSTLYGWLAGYFAADGCVDTRGGAKLASANRGNLEAVRSIAAVLGIDTWPIRESMRKGYGEEETPLYEIAFSGLPFEFFLIPKHRERVIDAAVNRANRQTITWVVESVEDTGSVEETFCCVVPTTSSFLLADGLITSNCIEGLVSQNGTLIAKLDISITEQVRAYRRLMMHQIAVLAPLARKVIIPVVPGNHDETTRIQQMPVTDSWAIEGASAVADWMDGRPEYEHVRFVFPKAGEPDIYLEVTRPDDEYLYGVSFIHGHTAGSNPAKVLDWWKGQSHGRQRAMNADMLVSAHYHHLRVEHSGGNRTWLQIPALDGGSSWYRHRTGEEAFTGIVSVEITPGYGQGWKGLTVHS